MNFEFLRTELVLGPLHQGRRVSTTNSHSVAQGFPTVSADVGLAGDRNTTKRRFSTTSVDGSVPAVSSERHVLGGLIDSLKIVKRRLSASNGYSAETSETHLSPHVQIEQKNFAYAASCCPDTDRDDKEKEILDMLDVTTEYFSFSQFAIDLTAHMVSTCLGPLSLPFLAAIYEGSLAALRNRAFIPRISCPMSWMFFFMQTAQPICYISSFALFMYWETESVYSIEYGLLFMFALVRALTISIKYGFLPPLQYAGRTYQRECHEASARIGFANETMVFGWNHVSAATAEFQARRSLAVIAPACLLNDEAQDPQQHMRLLPWQGPHMFESSDRAHTFMALGRSLAKKSFSARRKALPLSVLMDKPKLEAMAQLVADTVISQCLRPGTAFDFFRTPLPVPRLAHQVGSAPSVSGAGHKNDVQHESHVVSVRGMYFYLVQALLEMEKEKEPRVLLYTLRLAFALLIAITPGFARMVEGHGFFGGKTDGRRGEIVSGLLFFVTFAFTATDLLVFSLAVKDVWRRFKLLSWAGVLLSWEPSERARVNERVGALPVLDTTDAETVRNWRRLRKLLMDWGQGFSSAFTGVFLVVKGALQVYLIAKIHLRPETVTLCDLLTITAQSVGFGALFLAVVLFGHYTNQLVDRHMYLINAHRVQALDQLDAYDRSVRHSTKHAAVDSEDDEDEWCQEADGGKAREMLRAVRQLSATIKDIEHSHKQRPVLILGMEAGIQRLASVSFEPAALLSSVQQFCYSEEYGAVCGMV